MAKNFKTSGDWRDIGDPKKRQEARRQQEAIDAAYREQHQGFKPTGTGIPTPQPTTHTIADGQSLDMIASQYGYSAQQLLDANPEMLTPRVGMVLSLPRTPIIGNYTPARLYALTHPEPPQSPLRPEQMVMSNGYLYEPNRPDYLPFRGHNWQANSPFWRNLYSRFPWFFGR